MTYAILNQEFLASRERVQRMLMISLLAHVLFFAWLLLRQEISPEPEGIVEISWLDPGSPGRMHCTAGRARHCFAVRPM